MLETVWRKGNIPALLVGMQIGEATTKNDMEVPRKTVWRFLQKLKLELSYDPTVPLQGINLKKTIIWKDTYTSMFIAALFIIAKTWRQPTYPSREKWIKMWYTHTHTHTHTIEYSVQFSSVQFSHSVMSNSFWPHESQHARPPCPSLSPGVHPNSRPLSQWCHPAISSSVVPFSSCPQSLPASESFPMSQLLATQP